jgi:hypothetical protein
MRLDVREVQQGIIHEGANVIAPNRRNIHFKDDDVRREEVRSKVTVRADRILYSHSCYRPHLLAEDIVIKQRNIRGSGRHEKVDHTSGEASADEGCLYADAIYSIDTVQGLGANLIWITPRVRKELGEKAAGIRVHIPG